MFCPECGNHAANKALRELGIRKENNSLSWDGNTEGKLVLVDTYARVSTKPFDLAQVEKVVFAYPDGSTLPYPVNNNNLIKGELLSAVLYGIDTPLVFVCTEEHYNNQYGTNIPVGVYVLRSDDGTYISAVKCTETTHPIDKKYLPDDTIDLTKFTCKVNGTEQTFNDAIMALFQQSMQNGGTMGIVDFTDESRQLSKAASSCNHPALMVKLGDDFVKYPTVYSFADYGAGQLAANGMTVTGYGPVDAACIIQFGSSGTSGHIYVSAKVLA